MVVAYFLKPLQDRCKLGVQVFACFDLLDRFVEPVKVGLEKQLVDLLCVTKRITPSDEFRECGLHER